MKFATALLALATAAMASPTKFALEERHEMEHQTNGPCNNWVVTDSEHYVIETHARTCLDVEGHKKCVSVDKKVGITILRQIYTDFGHLFCDPKHTSTQGERINEAECWEYEFEEDSYESN